MSKKTIILIIIAVILAISLIIGGYFYWKSNKNSLSADEQKTLDDAAKSAESLNDAVMQGVLPDINTNPLEGQPDVNPASANPLKDIKVNPFE